ncbi:hypothetical protein [Nocardia brasiliensis]|uniref:Uncharacterized protein n=1 Tax=Nocardia brasiliensis (strain ATCC 700358 / HUJEG-1) TaxID=1133849 RepID=K0EQI7_NOCB7|nr:hypothetical protein [Nocardia brasiliensis]AFU02043.1 hypothetical protein O3I_020420 [Nocardia brasiliensis ATCC 700358]OCF87737.1 hypothetical protein AW168_24985 [Nocardia brasiliensis]
MNTAEASPELLAPHTSVDADVIRELARAHASARLPHMRSGEPWTITQPSADYLVTGNSAPTHRCS